MSDETRRQAREIVGEACGAEIPGAPGWRCQRPAGHEVHGDALTAAQRAAEAAFRIPGTPSECEPDATLRERVALLEAALREIVRVIYAEDDPDSEGVPWLVEHVLRIAEHALLAGSRSDHLAHRDEGDGR